MTLLEWPDRLPGLDWLPAYWGEHGEPFGAVPDLIIIHSASTAAWVAEYLSNPIAAPPRPGEPLRGRYLCKDGIWRRQACAHFSWYSGRENKLLPGVKPPPHGSGFVQQTELTRTAWGSAGSLFLGQPGTNYRAIHVELPGPYSRNPRLDIERYMLRALLLNLKEAMPRPDSKPWKITGHQFIHPRKKDPGPGVDASWFQGFGFDIYWYDCRKPLK